MSPFTLNVGAFVLYYAVFGYGLILITLIGEEMDKFSWLLIALAALASAALLVQQTGYYFPVHFAFQAAIAFRALLSGGRKTSAVLSIVTLALFPVLTVWFCFVFLGLTPESTFWKVASTVYPVFSAALVLFDNPNGRLKKIDDNA
jgi:hypothetical protein